MTRSAAYLSALTALLASGQGVADVIYSNFQNITIPTTYSGINIDVDGVNGWDLNPFMGGAYLYNSAAFQPARSGTGVLDTVLNFTPGSTIGSGLNFATFSGGSMSHLGSQFTAGQEGYLGFRLNGTNYGSMRVVFTSNNSGAVIKDWAYDTGGASVQAGAIKQVGQDIILSSGFTLASSLADSGGPTNLVKQGGGTITLSAENHYTGATTVSAGTLLVNNTTGSGTGAGAVSVGVNGTLGGTGTIGGATTVDGALKPGNSTGLLTVGSLDLNASASTTLEINGTNRGAVSNGYDALGLNTGDSIDFAGALIFEFGNLAAFAGNTEFDLFSFTTTSTGDFAGVTSTGFYAGTWSKSGETWSLESGSQTLNFSEVTGNLVVVPEPGAALLGGLGLLALLRRRRWSP